MQAQNCTVAAPARYHLRVAFPEGLHEKKGQLLRPDVLQPKMGYDARELEAGPGVTAAEPPHPKPEVKEDRVRAAIHASSQRSTAQSADRAGPPG